jgi:uncharacterized integral membrane protein (TIGR00698 family)
MAATEKSEVVVDRGKWEWSELWKKEDWWAIWLGFIILIVGLIIFLPRPPAEMHEKLARADATMARKMPGRLSIPSNGTRPTTPNPGSGPAMSPTAKPWQKWRRSPVAGAPTPSTPFTGAKPKRPKSGPKPSPPTRRPRKKPRRFWQRPGKPRRRPKQRGFANRELNSQADAAIREWRGARDKERSLRGRANTQADNKIPYLLGAMILIMLFFAIGTRFMGINTAHFIKGFWFVFLLAIAAYIIGNNSTMREYGFGALIWGIVLGLLISNTVGTPNFVKSAIQTEYFIKTGLVLLGAEILFSKMVAIGLPGIVTAWLVTPTVLILTFIFGQKVLKMESKTLNITVSADMSVCGVSAAIATAAACRATKEELTIAVGMSMLFTAVMMIALPTFIVAIGLNPVWGGAWIGGTIDSTGAVVAAGAFLGEAGMFVAATVKMIQNILIGVIAFAVAVYWCARVDCVAGQQVSKMEIWYRFPKFVLGFIAASFIFSTMLVGMGSAGDVMIDQGVLRGFSRPLRDWFFILAFVSIGLSADFRALARHFTGGKPVILYVCGQSLNLLLTFLVAGLMFMVVFRGVTDSLLAG